MRGRAVLGALTGLLLLASGFAHALLGWPPFRELLTAAGLDPEIIGALAVGWAFGSTAMLVFGAVVLLAAANVWRAREQPTGHLWIIAAGYLAFGLTAFLSRDLNPHFLLFVVTGLLVAAFAYRRR